LPEENVKEKTNKNVWIIPPHTTKQVTLMGASDHEIEGEPSGTIVPSAESLHALGFGPALKCDAVGTCGFVKLACTNLLIRQCLSLIGCGAVTCTGLTVTKCSGLVP
jgi:hypothetical protein